MRKVDRPLILVGPRETIRLREFLEGEGGAQQILVK